MGQHVDGDGQVDYAGIKENPAALKALVAAIKTISPDELAKDDRKAFLVNAYNVLVIENIINHYPTDSPLSIEGFFDASTFHVGGKPYTLNDLEKGYLYQVFPDARLHFALVCAAKGCPVLIPTAYRGATLGAQLDAQTRVAMNSELHVRVETSAKTVHLSELFTWYASDFELSSGSAIDYVNTFRNAAIPSDFKVAVIPYNWELNSQN